MRKTLPASLVRPAPERHVVVLEDHPADLVRVVLVGEQDRREHRRVLALVEGEHLEAPAAHGRAGRLGVPLMTCVDVLQALLVQHHQRLAEAVEDVGGRGVGPEPVGVGGQDRLPVPVRARQLRRPGGLEGLVADRVEADARRQHEALLRARDGDVDLPLVVPVVDAAERGDGVDQEERRVPCRVDRLADRADPAGDAGRGLVVDHHHGLDLVAGVGREPLLHRLRRNAVPPVPGYELDLEGELAGHLLPEGGEVPGLEAQHLVARRQRVDQRGLPGAGARARIDDDRVGGAERRLDRFEDLLAQLRELRSAVVDGREVHGPQDPVGDVRRPRDLQEVTSPCAAACQWHCPASRRVSARCAGVRSAEIYLRHPGSSLEWPDVL